MECHLPKFSHHRFLSCLPFLHTQSKYQMHYALIYILDTLEKAYFLTLMKKESERKNRFDNIRMFKLSSSLFKEENHGQPLWIQQQSICSVFFIFETHPKFKSSFNSLIPTMKQNMLYISYYPFDKLLFHFIHLEYNNYFNQIVL